MSTTYSSDITNLEKIPASLPAVRGFAGSQNHNVAIVGFGTVGSSVARMLTGREIPGLRLSHICNRNIERKRTNWIAEGVCWTEDTEAVLCPDVDIVVELMGGLEPAGTLVWRALKARKSVVTANKQLIARHGLELARLAHEHGQQLLFGASVAGGIPVISGLQEGLAGDELTAVAGILNGTCNYILTRIESTGVSFNEALREAQKLGFAEANPTEDIDGLDARAKLAILARSALKVATTPDEIVTKTISMIQPVDFEYARLLNCTIRQVSRAKRESDKLFATVGPALVLQSSAFASVTGGRNIVVTNGKFGGETAFAGQGAGGNPTAVAVISDLMSIARWGRSTGTATWEIDPADLAVSAEFSTRHYLRFTVKDEPGIIAALAAIFSGLNINIDSVFQKPGYPPSDMPFVITLEACPASLVEMAMDHIKALKFQTKPCVHLPILD